MGTNYVKERERERERERESEREVKRGTVGGEKIRKSWDLERNKNPAIFMGQCVKRV
jgi:hypothetical protein